MPPALDGATLALWRSSGKAKWHWVGERSHCQHLPGNSYGGSAHKIVPEEIPALGLTIDSRAVCSSCIDRISLPPAAEAFITVTAELLRARDWLQKGRDCVETRTWSWLSFARWKVNRPLAHKRWEDVLGQIRGKNWAAAALKLRGLVADYHSQADALTRACIATIPENPARTSQVERAILMVETDSPAHEESNRILRISGCRVRAENPWGNRSPYEQNAPWEIVAATWRSFQLDRKELVLLDALCDYFDEKFPHVHDLAALDGCIHHTPAHEPGECLQSWAWRSARAHRRAVVEQWLSRLDLALDGISSANRDPAADCTHLVAVPFWPPVLEGMEPVAYLSQFDVVAGPFTRQFDYSGAESVVVLRVPEWAAKHAEQLRRPLRAVVIDDESTQAVQLARGEGIPVVPGEFAHRRKPSQRIVETRDEMGSDYYPDPGYRYYRRPLAPGAEPQQFYGRPAPDAQWTDWGIQQALSQGAVFVYGTDNLELLSLAYANGRWRPEVTLTVELQTECEQHREPGPHVCEVSGHISTMSPAGDIVFTPHGLTDMVEIPAPYIAAVTFR
ncbi:Uncharacterised protein [Mycobacteroides abscessus subsp. massiliense]|nr:Uncharacterised protein [Mycobacteroides abscessus subsp. massiliense]